MPIRNKYTIEPQCNGCGSCKVICPTHAISKGVPHTINQNKCIHCGKCVLRCWRKLIKQERLD